jgi:hypothetical protein
MLTIVGHPLHAGLMAHDPTRERFPLFGVMRSTGCVPLGTDSIRVEPAPLKPATVCAPAGGRELQAYRFRLEVARGYFVANPQKQSPGRKAGAGITPRRATA